MSDQRWDPLTDLLGLQERMNRLFDLSLERLDPPPRTPATWTPPADVYETRDAFVVHLELAGVVENQVQIQVTPRQLTVRGDRGFPAPERPANFHRMERCYGAFVRRLRFPAAVDSETLRTRFRHGVLRVELRKASGGEE